MYAAGRWSPGFKSRPTSSFWWIPAPTARLSIRLIYALIYATRVFRWCSRRKCWGRRALAVWSSFSARATLIFTDADQITQYHYRLDIGIAKPDEHNRDFLSLLGRDVLDCWYLESDPTNGLLQFTARRLL